MMFPFVGEDSAGGVRQNLAAVAWLSVLGPFAFAVCLLPLAFFLSFSVVVVVCFGREGF